MDVVNVIVDIAERLSRGGVVLILVMFCGLLMWACASMFRYITTLGEKSIEALTESAKTIEANTLMGEQSERQSEQNRLAIEGLTRAVIESRGR